MSIDTALLLIGAFIAALPFMGFPSSWDSVLLVIAGVFVIALAVALRRSRTSRGTREKKGTTDVFPSDSSREEGEHASS